MRKQSIVIWLTILILIVGTAVLMYQLPVRANRPVVINQTAVPPLPTLDSENAAQGEILYAQYCAKCHGVNLEGAPNWKQRLPDASLPPPPHDSFGHTWHHSDELLISITENGGDPTDNSKMLSFKNQLSRQEIIAIFEFIKSKWGRDEREYQWWITSRPNP